MCVDVYIYYSIQNTNDGNMLGLRGEKSYVHNIQDENTDS